MRIRRTNTLHFPGILCYDSICPKQRADAFFFAPVAQQDRATAS